VNQDAVSASLKNGVLIVTIPKAAPPAAKKIRVE
jgi:HSP20 family molecular chaperone IbpA